MSYLGGDDTPIKARGIETYLGEEELPSSRNLTVADFDGGKLDTDVWSGDTGVASVQNSIAKSGYALKIDGSSPSLFHIRANSGLENFPQAGDEFSYYIYFTDTGDNCFNYFASQSDVQAPDGYRIDVKSSDGRFRLLKRENANNTTLDQITGLNISSNINEFLKVTVKWSKDSEFSLTLTDSGGNTIGTLSATDSTYKQGGITYQVSNSSVAPTVYFDEYTIKRREPEYAHDTKKGITEAGNELTPSGVIHTGPQELPTNALRGVLNSAPVNADATQGEESLLTLLESGLDPAVILRRIMDGQGGAYGNQVAHANDRITRVDNALTWEFNTLSDVPNWDTYGSNITYSLTDRPRRIVLDKSGSVSGVDEGIMSNLLTTYQSLGGWEMTFKDVSFTDNTDTAVRIGVHDTQPEGVDNLKFTGNGIFLDLTTHLYIQAPTGGNSNQSSQGSAMDWTDNYDFTIRYDGSEITALIDGVLDMRLSQSVDGNLRPFVSMREYNSNSGSDTLEIGQVTISHIGEVLQ